MNRNPSSPLHLHPFPPLPHPPQLHKISRRPQKPPLSPPLPHHPQQHQPRRNRHQNPPPDPTLPHPGLRHGTNPTSRDDTIVRSPLGHPPSPVPHHNRRPTPRIGEMPPSRLHNLRLKIDTDHPPIPQPMSQQPGVVPTPGPHLKHPIPVPHIKGNQHQSHERRLTTGRNQLPVPHPGSKRHILINPPPPPLPHPRIGILLPHPPIPTHPGDVEIGHEQMPRHGKKRLPPQRLPGEHPALLDDPHQLPHTHPPTVTRNSAPGEQTRS